jgi:hypothetical protein
MKLFTQIMNTIETMEAKKAELKVSEVKVVKPEVPVEPVKPVSTLKITCFRKQHLAHQIIAYMAMLDYCPLPYADQFDHFTDIELRIFIMQLEEEIELMKEHRHVAYDLSRDDLEFFDGERRVPEMYSSYEHLEQVSIYDVEDRFEELIVIPWDDEGNIEPVTKVLDREVPYGDAVIMNGGELSECPEITMELTIYTVTDEDIDNRYAACYEDESDDGYPLPKIEGETVITHFGDGFVMLGDELTVDSERTLLYFARKCLAEFLKESSVGLYEAVTTKYGPFDIKVKLYTRRVKKDEIIELDGGWMKQDIVRYKNTPFRPININLENYLLLPQNGEVDTNTNDRQLNEEGRFILTMMIIHQFVNQKCNVNENATFVISGPGTRFLTEEKNIVGDYWWDNFASNEVYPSVLIQRPNEKDISVFDIASKIHDDEIQYGMTDKLCGSIRGMWEDYLSITDEVEARNKVYDALIMEERLVNGKKMAYDLTKQICLKIAKATSDVEADAIGDSALGYIIDELKAAK